MSQRMRVDTNSTTSCRTLSMPSSIARLVDSTACAATVCPATTASSTGATSSERSGMLPATDSAARLAISTAGAGRRSLQRLIAGRAGRGHDQSPYRLKVRGWRDAPSSARIEPLQATWVNPRCQAAAPKHEQLASLLQHCNATVWPSSGSTFRSIGARNDRRPAATASPATPMPLRCIARSGSGRKVRLHQGANAGRGCAAGFPASAQRTKKSSVSVT